LAKALHVLLLMPLLGSIAMAEPLSYPKPATGQCAGN